MTIYTKALGTIKCYNTKHSGLGLLVWMFCKDGQTKMPEPVFLAEWSYVGQ